MSKKKIILIWFLCLSPFVGVFTIMYLTTLGVFGPLPSFDQLENPKSNLATIVYSADGIILGEYYYENRSNVKYPEISEHLIHALISTEDIRFNDHSGIDIRSLFRAVFGVFVGKKSGGASTITQQLSKMLFTERPASGVERVQQKLKEWVVAVRLEERYSKNEILTMYLNRFDWINQAVGLKSAAKIYFNTTPDKLTIPQAAMLVGMLKNPSLYNPKKGRNPEGTLNRRNVVLSQMKKNNKITQNQYDSLKVTGLNLDFQIIDHNEGPAPYFREQLRSQLKKWCSRNTKVDGGNYNMYTDGLRIYTTIDSRMQKHAEKAVKTHISELQATFYKHWKGYSKAPYPTDFSREQINTIIDQGIKRSERYRKLKNSGKSNKEIKDVFNEKVSMKLFSWKGEIDTILSPRDSVIYNKFFIHTGMMSMDPKTGHVKAYVGGINHKYFKYDHVLQGQRQVGSTFKPFLYALAMQEGLNPCDEVINSPVVFNAEKWGLEKDWIPSNSDSEYSGLSLELKFGLANSINTLTAFIMHQFGPQAVVDLAKQMGVKSNLLAVPSICLGTFDISVYEMVGAYSTFVNKGFYTTPIFITKITDKNGIILEEFSPKRTEAMSKKTAALMVKLLQGVVDGVYSSAADKKMGTGVRLRYKYKFTSEMGGKTGTTQNQSDGWFMGITPNLVTGVWSGCEDRSAHFRTIHYGQGANMALPVFAEFMKGIYEDEKITSVTQGDIFQFDEDISLWVEDKINCNNNSEVFEEEEKYSEETEDF
ncbi:MAG: penicillin-binding protein [Flavobacteriales bacterium]|nr:penicillin-binding protein [Flavobacteriales bacterium]